MWKSDSTTANITISLSEQKFITIAVDSLAGMIWNINDYKEQVEYYSGIAIMLDSVKRVQDNTIDILKQEIHQREPSFWDNIKFYAGVGLGILIVITSNLLVGATQ